MHHILLKIYKYLCWLNVWPVQSVWNCGFCESVLFVSFFVKQTWRKKVWWKKLTLQNKEDNFLILFLNAHCNKTKWFHALTKYWRLYFIMSVFCVSLPHAPYFPASPRVPGRHQIRAGKTGNTGKLRQIPVEIYRGNTRTLRNRYKEIPELWHCFV